MKLKIINAVDISVQMKLCGESWDLQHMKDILHLFQ